MKDISAKLWEAYIGYAKERGKPPTSFSVGRIYKNEFDDMRHLSTLAVVQVSTAPKDSFMGLPITWTNAKRIECLPRRKSAWNRRITDTLGGKALQYTPTYHITMYSKGTGRSMVAAHQAFHTAT